MNDWMELDEIRLYKKHQDGFYIIIPKECEEAIPFKCPVCRDIQKTQDDSSSYREYKCCYSCSLKWAEANKEKWKNEGWRPLAEEVQKEIELREKILKHSFKISDEE